MWLACTLQQSKVVNLWAQQPTTQLSKVFRPWHNIGCHPLPPEERRRPPKKRSVKSRKNIHFGDDNRTFKPWTSTHIGQPLTPMQHATMKTQPIGHPPSNKCTKQPKPATKVQPKWRCLAGTDDIATESTKSHVPPEMGFNHRHSNIKGSQTNDSSQYDYIIFPASG